MVLKKKIYIYIYIYIIYIYMHVLLHIKPHVLPNRQTQVRIFTRKDAFSHLLGGYIERVGGLQLVVWGVGDMKCGGKTRTPWATSGFLFESMSRSL